MINGFDYSKYLKTKKKILNQILDIYEFKLDYDKNEIIKQMLSFRNAYAHADDS